ncbi:MAG: phosphate ABC transporter permease PstA [Rhodospirillaceae bacterium]|nr:phosphate ABC transporter permease PstA [Rhodospirillaceae bacterium]
MSSHAKGVKERVAEGIARRYRRERNFRLAGLGAVLVGMSFLGFFFYTLIGNGYTAFLQTHIQLDVELSADVIDPDGERDPQVLGRADYQGVIRNALRARFPDVTSRNDLRELFALVSPGAGFELRSDVLSNPELVGEVLSLRVVADDDVDMLIKGHMDRTADESQRRISDAQLGWIEQLEADGSVSRSFNHRFFTSGDSRDPEMSGIWSAVVGSFFMLLVTLALSFPLGVATAIYLEEFAPKNRWTDLIEVNINNLAAVPSIVFGLLGLALFINIFGLPRSAPVVGGLVLTLMTLPVVIIAARAALMSVPPSIREAALGVGASKMQTIFHHVMPLAMPGMLTGTIIGMARALGESAPLLMIGMVAFIVDVPESPLDPATALPVQVYLWADSPERAFVERTSAAILVLLAFLLVMNATAILLRKRYERRW